MSEQKPDHLYIMQASSGSIKIGRAKNVEVRRRAIQSACGLEMDVLLIVRDLGDAEPFVHERLNRYRLFGEWYPCTLEFKAALCKLAEVPIKFRYPLPGPTKKGRRADRVRRYVMKDGTVKVYRYGPWPRDKAKEKDETQEISIAISEG